MVENCIFKYCTAAIDIPDKMKQSFCWTWNAGVFIWPIYAHYQHPVRPLLGSHYSGPVGLLFDPHLASVIKVCAAVAICISHIPAVAMPSQPVDLSVESLFYFKLISRQLHQCISRQEMFFVCCSCMCVCACVHVCVCVYHTDLFLRKMVRFYVHLVDWLQRILFSCEFNCEVVMNVHYRFS